MIDWNPDLYLKFGKERTLPSKDLISRIGLENPARILDIGCGSGNSTNELKKRKIRYSIFKCCHSTYDRT